MERAKFWIDFDGADLCRADGAAIACMKAAHCDPTPENLEELDKILKDAHRLQEQVKLLQEVAEDARKELEAQATCFGHHLDPESNLFRILRKLESILEATKKGA